MPEKIDIVIDAKDHATRTFNNVRNAASSLIPISLSLAGGLYAIKKGFDIAINASSQMKNTMIGLQTVARAFGIDENKATEAAKMLAEDGLMTVAEAAAGLKNLFSRMGLEDAIRLMKGTKDSAAFNRQAFFSFGEAVVRTTEGIKNLMSNTADAGGVTKNLSIIMKEAGYSMEDLDKADKKVAASQALVNGWLKETSKFSGDAARMASELSGKQSQLTTQFNLAAAAIGDKLTPAYKVLIDLSLKVVTAIKTGAEELGTSVKTMGDEAIEAKMKLEAAGLGWLSAAMDTQKANKTYEASMLSRIAIDEEFAKLYPDIAADIQKKQKETAKLLTEPVAATIKQKITVTREPKEQFEQEKAGYELRSQLAESMAKANEAFWESVADKRNKAADKEMNDKEEWAAKERRFEESNIKFLWEYADEQERIRKDTEDKIARHRDETAKLYAEIGMATGAAMGKALQEGKAPLKEGFKALLTETIGYLEREILAARLATAIQGIFSGGLSLAKDIPMLIGAEVMLTALKAQIQGWQMGTPYVRQAGPAMLHQGERILSSTDNRMMVNELKNISSKLDRRQAGGNVTIQALDTQSFQEFMRRTGNNVLAYEAMTGRLAI